MVSAAKFAKAERDLKAARPSRSSCLLLHDWLNLILPWVKRSRLPGRQNHSLDLRLKSALLGCTIGSLSENSFRVIVAVFAAYLSICQPCLNLVRSICPLKSISVGPIRILTVNVPQNRDWGGSL